ncbi:nuclear transport factor 2 family protein [Insolitispirillum peregrinum]|uniref:SnoaL-like domain-containing protein n=1 Tax=Insolitispirillum peregrinum TaxID=80876 RepID=A0A1N7IHY2_9PROT|nr:nuclear transport factor 2 family protein [Insolitispirillum peregrinum]SIS36693.1 SnoaL-like domain-containing protein [Insolitispirillum peregrinum]
MHAEMSSRLAVYARAFETLSPGTVADLLALVDPAVRFKDPFNDVTGRAAMGRILQHMFDTTDQPRFVVHHQALDGSTGYLRWTFHARIKGIGDWSVEGMSEVRLSGDGLVLAHVDYWDAAEQFYERLPLLGAVLRWIKRRLTAR